MNRKQILLFAAAMLPAMPLFQATVLAGPEKALETGLWYAQRTALYAKLNHQFNNAAETIANKMDSQHNKEVISLAFSDNKGFWFGTLGLFAAAGLVAWSTHIYQKYRAQIDTSTSNAVAVAPGQQNKVMSNEKARLSEKAFVLGTLTTLGLGIATWKMGEKAIENTGSVLNLFIRNGYLLTDLWRAWRA